MGFSDTFMVLGIVLLLSAGAILLTRKTKAPAGGGAGAH
jgi:DHA2 family multidrug resistance protein